MSTPKIPPLMRAKKQSFLAKMKALLPPFLVLVLVLLGWQLVAATIYGDRNFLVPRPLQVGSAVAQNLDVIVGATLVTLREAASGFALAITVGVLVAAVLSQSKILERSFYPYIVLLQTVPIVAVAPLIVLWFGYDELSVVIISFMISLFPIVNNTLLGLVSTPRTLLDLFAMHRGGRIVEFWKLRLPQAAPNILAGVRISAGLSVIGAIVGEFLIGSGSSKGGLGVQVIFAQGRMFTALLFGEALAATLLGFLFFTVVSVFGNRFLSHWHESAAR